MIKFSINAFPRPFQTLTISEAHTPQLYGFLKPFTAKKREFTPPVKIDLEFILSEIAKLEKEEADECALELLTLMLSNESVLNSCFAIEGWSISYRNKANILQIACQFGGPKAIALALTIEGGKFLPLLNQATLQGSEKIFPINRCKTAKNALFLIESGADVQNLSPSFLKKCLQQITGKHWKKLLLASDNLETHEYQPNVQLILLATEAGISYPGIEQDIALAMNQAQRVLKRSHLYVGNPAKSDEIRVLSQKYIGDLEPIFGSIKIAKDIIASGTDAERRDFEEYVGTLPSIFRDEFCFAVGKALLEDSPATEHSIDSLAIQLMCHVSSRSPNGREIADFKISQLMTEHVNPETSHDRKKQIQAELFSLGEISNNFLGYLQVKYAGKLNLHGKEVPKTRLHIIEAHLEKVLTSPETTDKPIIDLSAITNDTFFETFAIEIPGRTESDGTLQFKINAHYPELRSYIAYLLSDKAANMRKYEQTKARSSNVMSIHTLIEQLSQSWLSMASQKKKAQRLILKQPEQAAYWWFDKETPKPVVELANLLGGIPTELISTSFGLMTLNFRGYRGVSEFIEKFATAADVVETKIEIVPEAEEAPRKTHADDAPPCHGAGSADLDPTAEPPESALLKWGEAKRDGRTTEEASACDATG